MSNYIKLFLAGKMVKSGTQNFQFRHCDFDFEIEVIPMFDLSMILLLFTGICAQ